MKRRKTVLVVEDDGALRHLYWQALTFEGFHVVTAEDGLTALDCMRHAPPSVVVLDLNVPAVPGGEISVHGTVIGATPGVGFAVRFADMDDATNARLRGLVGLWH